jgi:hypothetical protein
MRYNIGFICPLSLIFILLLTTHTYSQTDNYWSWNFNTPSTLLAGAVVGGNAGPSAVFYNPALVDHENIPSLSLSANIISLQFFTANDIAGEGIGTNKFIFKIQPRFISYTIPTRNDKLGAEAAILSPVSDQFKFTIQHFDTLDLIHRTKGEEVYSGHIFYDREFDDTWAGAGLSYQISKKFYVGISSFLSVKIMNYHYSQLAEAFRTQDSVVTNEGIEAKYIASSSFEEDMKYWFLSFIFKLGMQYKSDNEQFSAGLSITLPDLPIYGQADVRKAVSRSNVYNDLNDSFISNENTIQVEEKAKVRVKNPFSIAVGAQYITKNRRNSVLLTIEYFHHIDSYAVVNSSLPPPDWLPGHIQENLTNRDFMSYYFEASAVTNAAIGFKQYISPKLFFLGGFRTDFTVSDQDNSRYVSNKFSVNQVHFDKYHITAGAVLEIKKFKVISGVQYTRGRNRGMTEIINYSDPVEYNPLTDQALEGIRQNNAEVIYNDISLFFGVSVDLK